MPAVVTDVDGAVVLVVGVWNMAGTKSQDQVVVVVVGVLVVGLLKKVVDVWVVDVWAADVWGAEVWAAAVCLSQATPEVDEEQE